MALRCDAVSLWKTQINVGRLKSCYTCLHTFYYWTEWKNGSHGLHTRTLISSGKKILSFIITAPSTSKASLLLLVFLWMWWRWVTERTKTGNFQGLHISLKIISTKLRVIAGRLASIIMLWELLNRYYLTGSLPWKSSDWVCEVGEQWVLCQVQWITKYVRVS